MHALSTAPTSSSYRSVKPPRRYTLEDWLKIPEEKRCELINGKLIYQTMPGPIHGIVQGSVDASIRRSFHRQGGHGAHPGGWWISLEVDLDLRGFGCRPDVVGWRRDRHPKLPEPDTRGLVTAVPDWVCEVLSKSTASIDLGPKRQNYFETGVEHYWIVDPQNETLTVFRHSHEDYRIALVAGRGDCIRIEPFELIEISVSRLFGYDDDEEETSEETLGSVEE